MDRAVIFDRQHRIRVLSQSQRPLADFCRTLLLVVVALLISMRQASASRLGR